MQILYPKYKFSTVIIIVGGMGAIPKNFYENLRKLNIQEERLNTVQQRIQKAAIIGTIKICKTVMKMWNLGWTVGCYRLWNSRQWNYIYRLFCSVYKQSKTSVNLKLTNYIHTYKVWQTSKPGNGLLRFTLAGWVVPTHLICSLGCKVCQEQQDDQTVYTTAMPL